MTLPSVHNCKIAIIGLGYVGLPLAVAFSTVNACKKTKQPLNRCVIGFDINSNRLSELRSGFDSTNETSSKELSGAINLSYTDTASDLLDADVFIITVPTPVDDSNRPDLTPLLEATKTVAHVLNKRNKPTQPLVIYESTVFPGATEDVCVPILESISLKKYNKDFYCGYSPERINPGDKDHRLDSIVKVTSGSSIDSAKWIDELYSSIISAGTHLAPSISVAESAKVIENTQRDLNIALINELSIIFNKLNIDTYDVLKASRTKWNFLDFRPGLVGGHCIGVDPYYLTYKAEQLGYYPEVVLAGRRINDGMPKVLAQRLILSLVKHSLFLDSPNVLILGLTFKENCPDLRNSKVFDFAEELSTTIYMSMSLTHGSQRVHFLASIHLIYSTNCLSINTLL